MSTKKKSAGAVSAAEQPPATGRPRMDAQRAEAYEAVLKEYEVAVGLLRKGDYATAKQQFDKIAAANRREPELAERSRSYAKICERKLAPPQPPPQTQDERYYRAVVLSNEGQWNDAIKLLDESLKTEPTSVRYLYARASAWGLNGNVEAAVADLRQAIAVDPKVRYQATADPDFERIREEPSFIDLIEPTPSGN